MAPAAHWKTPAWTPPPSKLNLAASTSTVPLLLNSASMMAGWIPADFRKRPKLLKTAGVLDTLIRAPKARSTTPPAWLLMTAPSPIVQLPALQINWPALFSVRPARVALPVIVNIPPWPMVVAANPLMVPPIQARVPSTVRFPPPVRTLWETVNSSLPLRWTRLEPSSWRVARSMARVCVPLAPPTVRLPAWAVEFAGTVTL